jgi:hypothetical protein
MRLHHNLLFVEQRINEEADLISTHGQNDA